jgi:membrane associated rhomboid family serine protease
MNSPLRQIVWLPMDEATVTTCYRHPDRATGLSCSTCGRPICVECSRDTPVGQKCPECAGPTGRHKVINARQQFNRPTPVSQAILIINVGIFVLAYLTGRTELTIRFGQINELILSGEWYRMITAAFLHADPFHIFFNMYALYIFGPQIERQMGGLPFAAMYVSAALAGSAAYLVSGAPNVAIGASGAIFGLFGAWMGATYSQRHTPAGRALFRRLAMLLGINLALPLFVARIAWEAHVGGLIAGLLIVTAWQRIPGRDPRATALRTASALAVGAAAVLMALLVV